MRIFIIGLLMIINLIFVVQAFIEPLSISYLSLRVILAAFSLVICVYLLLLCTHKFAMYLTILTLIISLIHIFIIAHSAYLYIY
ncbi:membrane protein [Staphylococcus sp. NAM3COL9]|nr:membrane protein [Staphylococcus sp. NAM3COL9]